MYLIFKDIQKEVEILPTFETVTSARKLRQVRMVAPFSFSAIVILPTLEILPTFETVTSVVQENLGK